ncbi:hypothetical protein SPRG_00225 [Saprolegnia parasitica CBS 223.65]|uniref:Expansin-like EG45 domain-containing protein n=1 Tax=Saprolegnia parasitica (strain CBS 223.65) TaxID=695850 RepID=A0A067D9N7_SAPPC|nr:hypothetical protein SPRG_00225 [Saprolegnia parasitica CBS 223.65]KDO35376.1 hypothetical protein SPRG_00225 [Saprolegnia parasitica CBS 223.65]|eukprot:XP_012193721.1 hypothetical protein SPRG_00225 [Saprolegnia parasitica CBS 223.65]
MRLLLLTSALVAVAMAADTSASLLPYNAQAESGSCRITSPSGSKSTKYASIPGKVMATCGRCVQVTCKDANCNAGSSVVAYIVDTSASTNIGLSPSAMQALTSNTVNNPLSVTYKLVTCPNEFVPGNIQVCTQEGAGNSYLPLQFTDAYRVVTGASINGVPMSPSDAGFYYIDKTSRSDFNNIPITLSSGTVTVSGTVSFPASASTTRTCADLGAQFTVPTDSAGSSADPADGSKPGTSGSSSGSSSLVVPIVCGVAGLLVVIGIVVCVIRRRRAKDDDEMDNYENGLGTDHSVVHKDHGPVKKDPTPPPPPQGPIVPPSTTNDFPASTTAAYARMDSDPPAPMPTYTPTPAYTPTQVPVQSPQPVYAAPSPAYVASSQPTYVAAPAFVPPPQPTFTPPVVQERQPSLHSKAAARASQTAVTSPGPQSYSEMFNDRGTYVRPSARDERKSFDIDEERDDDAPVPPTNPHFDPNVLTSPESYVRATQMPRNARPQAPTFNAPERPSTHEMRPSSSSTGAGYSRDSLNLLDYSRNKKQGSSAVQF